MIVHATKRKDLGAYPDDTNSPPSVASLDDTVATKKPKLIPLDDACAHMFEDATRRSIELIKQHYQRRFFASEESAVNKLQRCLAERELDAAKIRRLEADKARVESHLSVLAARASKAEKDLRDAEATIDRLNHTLSHFERRPRHWEPGSAHW